MSVFSDNKQRRIWLFNETYFFVVLILLVSTMFAYFTRGGVDINNESDIVKLVEERLHSGKQFVEHSMVELEEEFLVGGKEAFISQAIKIEEKYPESFAFFLYKEGQLIAWSTNNIPISEQLKDISDNVSQQIGANRCLVYKRSLKAYTIIGLQLISKEYLWQNEILQNVMSPYFGVFNRVFFSVKGGIEIQVPDGKGVFYVQENSLGKVQTGIWSFILFSLAFLFYALLLHLIIRRLHLKRLIYRNILFFWGLVLWYVIHYWLGLPQDVFRTEMFSPSLYASSLFIDNLGHLFFGSYILFISFLYFYLQNSKYHKPSVPVVYFNFIVIYTSFTGIMKIVLDLINNSQINLNLYKLGVLDLYSYMGVSIIFFLQLAWIVLSYRLIKWSKRALSFNTLHFLLASLLSLGINYFIRIDISSFIIFNLIIVIFVVFWYYFCKIDIKRRYVLEIFFYLVLLSGVSYWFLNKYYDKKEKDLRRNQALTWESKNDPFLEERFIALYPSIQESFASYAKKHNALGVQIQDSVRMNRIIKPFFKRFLPYYDIHVQYLLDVKDTGQVVDNNFRRYGSIMDRRLENAEDIIAEDTLYLLHGDLKYKNYLGRVLIDKKEQQEQVFAYIDFVSKPQVKELGLPALLQNNSYAKLKALNQYSYAIYTNGYLVEQAGAFSYQNRLEEYYLLDGFSDGFYYSNGYSHYYYRASKANTLVLSLPMPSFFDHLSAFAFTLMWFIVLSVVIYSILFNRIWLAYFSSFQGQLQYAILGLLIFSFIPIGAMSLYNIYELNDDKNKKLISEKAVMIFNILKNRDVDIDLKNLYEFFHTDVILYDKTGKLMVSTRPEVFEFGLLASFINPRALYQTQWGNSQNINIQEEHIGKQMYYSCYILFELASTNEQVYLNMPYFAKQNEIEDEISNFAQAFLNVYLFLLIFAIIIGMLVSRMLSRPIEMIKDKIKQVSLHHANEKIEWNRDDELLGLVQEYNRMVDELSVSAAKLAESERNAAWREMAQQVAHEIKNPLTPMKLNVQFLQRAWENKAEDFDQKMQNITQALEEQIDVLTHIASQFSTYAAITSVNIQRVDIKHLIENVLEVFKSAKNIKFTFESNVKSSCVIADKAQMIRVFNNLYKNSIQAIGNEKQGLIQTKMYHFHNKVFVEIKDNGCGIKPEQFEYIFQPHFTTKTTGTGLGLALVKKMVETAGGTINMTSVPDVYTKVTIGLPLCGNEET